MKRNWISRAVMAGAAAAALSCDSSQVTGLIDADQPSSRAPLIIPASAKPLTCPTNDSFVATSEIGPLGGVITTEGASVSVPAGALLSTVSVTLSVPASNYMEIDVSVAGVEHFVFEQPIVVTVSYARCTRNNVDSPLTAWYWDPATKTLLEPQPSVDDQLLRSVTFTTGHLSGYILAN